MQALVKGRYRARLAQRPEDLDRALSLRQRQFRASQARSDADDFDAQCRHVLVEDSRTDQLVCCFRLMPFATGDAVGRSYSAQFYDLGGLARYDRPLLELGRFCTDPQSRDPDILRLAWAALTRQVDAQDVGLLFGCSSFSGADPKRHAPALDWLGRSNLAPPQWMPGRKAAEVVAFARAERPVTAAPASLPGLLRSYLAMGGFVSDHAVIDRDLDTLHVFTGLAIRDIPASRVRLLRDLAG